MQESFDIVCHEKGADAQWMKEELAGIVEFDKSLKEIDYTDANKFLEQKEEKKIR